MNQIAIFEQYLKVAILQHKARQQEDKDLAKSLGTKMRNNSMDILNRVKDFEFDDK